jgi:hypothetical protein
MYKGNRSELSFKSEFCLSYIKQHYMKPENREKTAKKPRKPRKTAKNPGKNCENREKTTKKRGKNRELS